MVWTNLGCVAWTMPAGMTGTESRKGEVGMVCQMSDDPEEWGRVWEDQGSPHSTGEGEEAGAGHLVITPGLREPRDLAQF